MISAQNCPLLWLNQLWWNDTITVRHSEHRLGMYRINTPWFWFVFSAIWVTTAAFSQRDSATFPPQPFDYDDSVAVVSPRA